MVISVTTMASETFVTLQKTSHFMHDLWAKNPLTELGRNVRQYLYVPPSGLNSNLPSLYNLNFPSFAWVILSEVDATYAKDTIYICSLMKSFLKSYGWAVVLDL